jgi:predicted RNase H-like HicB family nuclease
MSNYIKTDGRDNVMELQLNVLVFQEGEYYVAYCPSLNLSSYGDSVQEAKEGFDETMKSYIEDCESYHSLTEDLTKLGWKVVRLPHQNRAEPPAQVELDIPAGTLKTQFNQNWMVPA